MQRGIVKNMN